MVKLTTVYLMVFLSISQACNPNQNATAPLLTPSLTNHTRSATTTTASGSSSIVQTKNKTSSAAAMENRLTATPEEYTSNCHNRVQDGKNDNSSIKTYQHIVVSGLPFQRGQSHGMQAKDKILRMISFYKASSSMPEWNECISFVNNNYVKGLKRFYPNGLEEMRGIADGAGVPLEDILILNSRYELARWKRSQRMQNPSAYPEKKAKPSNESPACIQQNSVNSSAQTTTGSSVVAFNKQGDGNEEGTDECTGGVALSSATKYGHVLLGQNWDINEFILNNDTAILLEVHPDPCENIKPFVMLTEAGQLGRSGMNADGLGVVAMGLWSSADTFQSSNDQGWIPISLLRRMFLESPNFSLGLRTVLRAPVHVSSNMIIATGEDEALNIELTPNGYFTTHVPLEKEIFTHSNHFKSASVLARNDIREGSRGSSSLFRDRRVEKHLLSAWPRITEETFQTALKDHVGFPNSVCEHSVPEDRAWTSAFPRETTVASIIYNLSQRTLQLAKGPPCTGAYKTYCFKFSQL